MAQLVTSPYVPPQLHANYLDDDNDDNNDNNDVSVGRLDYRRASTISPLSLEPFNLTNPVYSRSSWCSPTNQNFRARPEQLAAVEAVPLNAMTLAGRQNDILFSSVLADRLRGEGSDGDDDDELVNTTPPSPPLAAEDDRDWTSYHHHIASSVSTPASPSGLIGIERCMSDPGAISPPSGGTVSNLLLCAPVFESPVRGTMSLDLVSQNFGRTRLNRLYNVRGSLDALPAAEEAEDEGKDVNKDKDVDRVVRDGWRRKSTGWASVKSSISSARPDLGGSLLDLAGLVKRTRSSDAGLECFDWVRSCGEEVCGADEDEAGATSLWQNKVFDKLRKGMRRHTVFWRG